MNTKTKLIAGTSAASLVFAIIHVLYGVYEISEATKGNDKNNITYSPMQIVLTDSTGKKDTMLYEEYIKKDSLLKAKRSKDNH